MTRALLLALLLAACRTATPTSTATPAAPHGHPRGAGLARDVDGDGYADVVDDRRELLRGGPRGLSRDRAIAITIPGHRTAIFFALALVGDVDGDGKADVMLGDPGCPDYAREMPECAIGHAYLYLGTADGLATTPAMTITASGKDTMLGSEIAPLGDVDGDGKADVALVARDALHVYLGAAGGLASTSIDLPSRYVYPVGDVDGDGKADFVLDDPQTVTLYTGGPPFRTRTIAVNENAEVFGTAAGGDFDGDGFADLALTIEPQDAAGDLLPNQVLIYPGGPDGPAATPTVTLSQDGPHGEFGGALVAVGDLDGDGFAELAVESSCAIYDDGGSCNGVRAYLFRGGPHGLATTPFATLDIDPLRTDTTIALPLSALGDVDGDGHPDVGFGPLVFRGAPGGIADLHPAPL